MRNRKTILALLLAALILVLTSCSGAPGKPEMTPPVRPTAAQAATQAPQKDEAGQDDQKDGPEAPGETEAPKAEASGDEGMYVLWEYEAGGTTIDHDMLDTAGMGETYLHLQAGGKAEFCLFGQSLEASWKPGIVTVYGTVNYTYTIDGDRLFLDVAGTHFTMVRDDAAAPAEPAKATPAPTEEPKETPKPTAEPTAEPEETKAPEETAVPSDVPQGDGIVSEETLQKGYVWMSKVAKDIFGTTYEELAEYFGVQGAFDKQEFNEHMGRNKRYYSWISEDDPTHFIYVNFDEKDAAGAPGVYKISSFNSSGFTSAEAEEKYLEIVKAEAAEAEKKAAADMPMKEFTIELHPFADKETTVKVTMQIPETGWSYDESWDKLIDNDDPDAWGAGFIQFKLEKDVEKFDFYKDKFENYKEIDGREFSGIAFNGRTYKNIGYEYTEYIAQIDEGRAVSIAIVDLDLSEGSMCDKILNSIRFD